MLFSCTCVAEMGLSGGAWQALGWVPLSACQLYTQAAGELALLQAQAHRQRSNEDLQEWLANEECSKALKYTAQYLQCGSRQEVHPFAACSGLGPFQIWMMLLNAADDVQICSRETICLSRKLSLQGSGICNGYLECDTGRTLSRWNVCRSHCESWCEKQLQSTCRVRCWPWKRPCPLMVASPNGLPGGSRSAKQQSQKILCLWYIPALSQPSFLSMPEGNAASLSVSCLLVCIELFIVWTRLRCCALNYCIPFLYQQFSSHASLTPPDWRMY